MSPQKSDFERAAARLREASRVLILCHEKPDGDTLGSAAALREALAACGVLAEFSAGSAPTARYAFLVEEGYVDRPDPARYDCIVAVDVAEQRMLGANIAFAERIDLLIDHHRTNSGFAALNLIDPQAAAAAELIFCLAQELGAPRTETFCRAIYTAISTDTGCYRFSNTRAESFAITAALFDAGFRPGDLNRRLFETRSRARIAIEQKVLSRVHYSADGAVATAVVTDAMRAETGADEDDMDGLSGLLRSIEGVEASALLKQDGENHFRISMRSNRYVDVAAVCGQFAGGGHARAAGGSVSGDAGTAERRVREALEQALAAGEQA